jgi:hypothetical protein
MRPEDTECSRCDVAKEYELTYTLLTAHADTQGIALCRDSTQNFRDEAGFDARDPETTHIWGIN